MKHKPLEKFDDNHSEKIPSVPGLLLQRNSQFIAPAGWDTESLWLSLP